jgi:hypothetical protein
LKTEAELPKRCFLPDEPIKGNVSVVANRSGKLKYIDIIVVIDERQTIETVPLSIRVLFGAVKVYQKKKIKVCFDKKIIWPGMV